MPSFIRANYDEHSGRLPRSFSFSVVCRLISVTVLAVVLGALAASCSDLDRRMGEREALDFRRNIVLKNYGNLLPNQRSRMMYHPARTRREIRLTLDDYIRKTARMRAREAVERSGQAAASSQRKALGVGEKSPGVGSAQDGSGKESRTNTGNGGAEAGPPPGDSSPDKEGVDG